MSAKFWSLGFTRSLFLQTYKLYLISVEGDAIVATEFEVVEHMVEVPSDVIIEQEGIIHHLALSLHVLGDLICSVGVGI